MPEMGQLTSVAASGPDDVWVLGETPTLLHFDGSSWSKVPTAEVAGPQLRGLVAFAPNDAWVVGTERTDRYAGECGEHGRGTRPLVEHWDGSTWREVASPSPRVHESELWSVSGSGSTDVWAVGYSSTDIPATNPGNGCTRRSHARTLAMHWDGSSWAITQTPNPGREDDVLAGITSLGPNDAWTTGWWIPGEGPGWPLFLHWDGQAWTVDPSLEHTSSQQDRQPWAADALASDDIWTAGSYPNAPSLQHWDGSEWAIYEDEAIGVDPRLKAGELTGISAISPSDIWAVGWAAGYESGRQLDEALILHWDGSRWAGVAGAPFPHG
ncbi:MAG TPA: hypothetical protein VNN79_20450 [Actinomycetota bacterium]|nr:hypothetical protein [Actinomycetota bacterium]